MTDGLFQDYRDRGVDSRDALIISEEERNADPLECDENENFLNSGTLQNWITLDPP